MMNLRPYQTNEIEEVISLWDSGVRRVCLQLPTGGGKYLGRNTPVLKYDSTIEAGRSA